MSQRYKARVLICAECGEEFIFTAEAQEYFAERGYTDDPKRCKTCHTGHKRKQRHGERDTRPAARHPLGPTE